MAWTYSDWAQQTTPALRLARLNLHIEEVTDKIGNEISGDGYAKGSNALTTLLDKLYARQSELEKRVERTANGGAIQIQFRDPTCG
ncbi:MAG TPA: hypothetical protein PLW65_20045 [Pseudomonadota bacterium]|nr:hypothetical protein [Pseudomonadota bacterium]